MNKEYTDRDLNANFILGFVFGVLLGVVALGLYIFLYI